MSTSRDGEPASAEALRGPPVPLPHFLSDLPDPLNVQCPYCCAFVSHPCVIRFSARIYRDFNGHRYHADRYRSAGHRLTGRGRPGTRMAT